MSVRFRRCAAPLAVFLTALLIAAAAIRSSWAASPDALVAYWPFDGTPAIALGSGLVWTAPATELAFAEGVNGGAVRLISDCRFGIGEDFPVAEGTFAAWVRPEFASPAEAPRYLLCLYGDRELESSWARNRWSVLTFGSRLTFEVYGDSSGKPLVAQATAPGLSQGGWHHVAATWSGLNSSTQAAVLRLYFDGALIASATAPQLPMGKTCGQLDLGRDSDGSPDYGEMRMDDTFLYARALSAEEIAAGVAATAQESRAPPPRGLRSLRQTCRAGMPRVCPFA